MSIHALNSLSDFRGRTLATVVALAIVWLLLPSPAAAVFGDGPASDEVPILAEIQVEGNTRTNSAYILREMRLTLGLPFTRERMDEAWDLLEDLGCFAYVDMEYDDFEGDEVTLIVTVEEEDTFGYGLLLRYSQRHKYLMGGWAEDTNLRGHGETLRADVSVLYIQRVGLTWTRPWFFGVDGLQGQAGISAEQADFVYRPFRYRKSNLDLDLRWSFGGPYFLTGGVNAGSFAIRDDFWWQLPERGINSPVGTERIASGTQSVLQSRAALGVDTRSNPWYPSRGVFAQAMLQRWDGSELESYNESSLDLRGFVPLPHGHHLLALRAWGRQTDGAAHLDNTCFFGGTQTVRGYRPGLREGDSAYLLTAEYRFPITMMTISPKGDLAGVGFHLFADAGDAWWHGSDAADALQSTGAGIHLNIDRVQIRFEAARTSDGAWSFEFGDVMTF